MRHRASYDKLATFVPTLNVGLPIVAHLMDMVGVARAGSGASAADHRFVDGDRATIRTNKGMWSAEVLALFSVFQRVCGSKWHSTTRVASPFGPLPSQRTPQRPPVGKATVPVKKPHDLLKDTETDLANTMSDKVSRKSWVAAMLANISHDPWRSDADDDKYEDAEFDTI
jgi:hypothetical protein